MTSSTFLATYLPLLFDCPSRALVDIDGTLAPGLCVIERDIKGTTIQRTIPVYDEQDLVLPLTLRSIYASLRINQELH